QGRSAHCGAVRAARHPPSFGDARLFLGSARLARVALARNSSAPNLSSVICAPVDNLPPRPDGLNPGRFPPERTSQVCEQPYLKSIYVWIVNRYHTWRGRSPAPPWLGPRRGRKNKLSGKLTTLFQAVDWACN